jgi:hypothetical protein
MSVYISLELDIPHLACRIIPTCIGYNRVRQLELFDWLNLRGQYQQVYWYCDGPIVATDVRFVKGENEVLMKIQFSLESRGHKIDSTCQSCYNKWVKLFK